MIAYFRLVKYFFIIFILLLPVFIIYNFEKKVNNRFYPLVYINKKDFGLKTKEEVASYFIQKNNDLKKINLRFFLKKTPVATVSGLMINLHYDVDGAVERGYLIGRTKNIWLAYYQKMLILFFKKKFFIEAFPSFDGAKIRELIINLEESYNKSAKNALFKFENNRVISFRQEEKGEKIVTDDFYQELNKKINELAFIDKKDVSIEIKTKIIEPEITLSQINSYGITELIGEGRSDFSHSIPERIYNIKLATSKFNGLLILKDKVFSFNEAVGEISSLTGYKPAYIIKNGKTILGDGGGVCQVSTTLFRAALNSGLEIVERHPHAYRVSYYENDSPAGFDATVFAPSVDLKIKNNTPAAILIQTEIDEENNLLYFRLYGKKDGRQVEIGKPVVWDVIPPPQPKYQDDPNLKRGVVKQIDFPAWGAKANFHYKVVKDGQTLFEKDFFSSYKPWQAVYLVGIAD